jgi:dipeptidyl aminopeptidase/acylaminoacyl peptidase
VAGGNPKLLAYIGGTPEQMPDRYRAASALTYVTRDDPPVLSIQGGKDPLCVPRQVEILGTRMREAGVPYTVAMKPDMGHELPWSDPSMWEFFDRTLRSLR